MNECPVSHYVWHEKETVANLYLQSFTVSVDVSKNFVITLYYTLFPTIK